MLTSITNILITTEDYRLSVYRIGDPNYAIRMEGIMIVINKQHALNFKYIMLKCMSIGAMNALNHPLATCVCINFNSIDILLLNHRVTALSYIKVA